MITNFERHNCLHPSDLLILDYPQKIGALLLTHRGCDHQYHEKIVLPDDCIQFTSCDKKVKSQFKFTGKGFKYLGEENES